MHMVTSIWAAEFAQGEFPNDFYDTIKALAIVVKEHVEAALQPNKQK